MVEIYKYSDTIFYLFNTYNLLTCIFKYDVKHQTHVKKYARKYISISICISIKRVMFGKPGITTKQINYDKILYQTIINIIIIIALFACADSAAIAKCSMRSQRTDIGRKK